MAENVNNMDGTDTVATTDSASPQPSEEPKKPEGSTDLHAAPQRRQGVETRRTA